MQLPLISIIIPCFNHGEFIEDAVLSVETSSYKNFEIVIIDDGSTESLTLNRLRQLKNTGYRVIEQKNQGVSSARNSGIAQSKGKYILPLDADNKITTEFISKAVEILEKMSDVDIVYSDRFIIKNDEQFIKSSGKFYLPRLLRGNYIDNCTVFRKSIWEKVGGYDKNIQGLEDYDFWLSAISQGANFYYIPEPLYFYRVHEKSVTQNAIKNNSLEAMKLYIFRKHADLHMMNYKHVYKLLFSFNRLNEKPMKASFKYFLKGLRKLIHSKCLFAMN